MKQSLAYFQRWVRKNPLILWWLIFLPLMLVILYTSWGHLTAPLAVEDNPPGFWINLVHSFPLVVLARIVLVAVGLVLIMICLFFPLFRVSKEGVQWTREQEEEIARVTGEITGAEVEELIQQETFRWSIILRWLRFCGSKEVASAVSLRELVATISEAFPAERFSILLEHRKKVYGLQHRLLPKLVLPDQDLAEAFGVKLSFGLDYALYIYLHAPDPTGFSPIDEQFMLVLCEIFGRGAQQMNVNPEELVAYFELVDNPSVGAGIK
ncbi:MAG: hypothetical protein GX202_03765 [Firmicutes bacterium]|nr:hypothetical protein [Bacillota bacterium]